MHFPQIIFATLVKTLPLSAAPSLAVKVPSSSTCNKSVKNVPTFHVHQHYPVFVYIHYHQLVHFQNRTEIDQMCCIDAQFIT